MKSSRRLTVRSQTPDTMKQRPQSKTCELCGKNAFDTEGAAMIAAMTNRTWGAPEMRVYACGQYWHLTRRVIPDLDPDHGSGAT